MLLMFTLRRQDVFPVDDFGVREGYRRIHGLSAQPKPKALAQAAQIYTPYRTIAALYLWRAADTPMDDQAAARKPPKPRAVREKTEKFRL
jgi:3-methyladenine DNA glycosylase/8-oxoguanine DNA glycosylase